MSKICSCLRKTTTLFSLLHLWHNAYSCILFPKTSQRRSSSFEANIIIGDSLCFLTQPHSRGRISRTSMCSAVKQTSLKTAAAPRSSWFQKRVREERIKTHTGGSPGLDLKICCNGKKLLPYVGVGKDRRWRDPRYNASLWHWWRLLTEESTISCLHLQFSKHTSYTHTDQSLKLSMYKVEVYNVENKPKLRQHLRAVIL